MATAPLPFSTGLVSFSVTAAGQTLANVVSITITKAINRICEARVMLVDGDPATSATLQSEADSLSAGDAVEIQVGYDTKNEVIFKGIIVEVGISARDAQGMLATVVCKDEAVKMTGGRRVLPFADQTMSDTLTQLVGTYGGLTANLAATTGVQPNVVQYNRSDWDFLVTQAEANGQVVLNDQANISTVKLSTAGSPVVALVYGTNVNSFDLRLNARHEFTSVVAKSWSVAQQATLTATANAPSLTTLGSITSSQQASALGQSTYTIRTAADVDQATLQALADAYLAKRVLALVQGTIEMPGTSLVVPGSLVSLDRLGTHFNGTGFVAGVTHAIEGGSWTTTATLGTDAEWFTERHPDVLLPQAALNNTAGIEGLYSAVVKATQPDADGEFRVQVTVAALADAVLWVRLALPYASSGLGMYFFPEVGDEVVLGFFGADVRYPVILGSLYSKSRTPAYAPDEKNTKKALVTSSQLTLEFDEDKKVITLKTPGGNSVVISDDAKGLTLTDQQGNSLTMSSSGLALVSKSALKLTADQDITIESTTGSVTLKAAQDLKAQGLNLSAAATTQLVLQSNGTAELSAGLETTVKGVLVKIN